MDDINIKIVESEQELRDAQEVRKKVFQEEQGIDTVLDFDGKDNEADHVIVYKNNEPIGAARVRLLDENKELAKIERVSVLKEHRKSGTGSQIMEYIHTFLEKRGIKESKLESQEYAKDFYKKLGYKQKGESFEEVGIPHVEMRKKFGEKIK